MPRRKIVIGAIMHETELIERLGRIFHGGH